MPTIWRIRDAGTFDALRRRGRRSRRGPVTVTFLADGSTHPRVAYAIGRRVGPAVVRNRLRRRLRGVLQERAAALPAGALLVSAGPEAVALSTEELRAAVDGALADLGRGGS